LTRATGSARARRKFSELGLQVLDDEDFLAASDQAELAAGDFLDRRRILGQPPRFFAQTRVFGLLAGDRCRQFGVLTPGAQHREQSLVADQRVHDNDHPEQHQQKLHDAPRSDAAPGV
jgi:hypothetical protein